MRHDASEPITVPDQAVGGPDRGGDLMRAGSPGLPPHKQHLLAGSGQSNVLVALTGNRCLLPDAQIPLAGAGRPTPAGAPQATPR